MNLFLSNETKKLFLAGRNVKLWAKNQNVFFYWTPYIQSAALLLFFGHYDFHRVFSFKTIRINTLLTVSNRNYIEDCQSRSHPNISFKDSLKFGPSVRSYCKYNTSQIFFFLVDSAINAIGGEYVDVEYLILLLWQI